MGFSQSDYLAMKCRLEKTAPVASAGQLVDQESKLHDQIIAFCNEQWPRWKFIHARMDQRSTIALGAQDFTIFRPDGRLLMVECKKKGGKLSPEQSAWVMEMALLGHIVYTIRSMDEFKGLL